MRAIEKSMVVSRMFDQAKALRQSSKLAERVETSERQDMARHEMDVERQRLLDRQERDLATLKGKCAQLLTVARKQVDTEERPLRAQLANLEKTAEDLRASPPVMPVTPFNVSTTPRDQDNELITPRTVFRFSTFKLIPMNPKLKIQPMSTMEGGGRKSRVIRVKASH
jgi:hypothetical protein